MADPEKLTDKKLLDAFIWLQTERVLVNLRLPGGSYERLTMVLDVRAQSSATSWFCIDPPRGFFDVVTDLQELKCNFSYTGDDKLEYRFATESATVEEGVIWIPMPKVIRRIQRRRHFRIEVPVATRISCLFNGRRQSMDVIDISVGGALVLFELKGGGAGSGTEIKRGMSLTELELWLPIDNESTPIVIEEAIVRRIDPDPNTGRTRYGIEFVSFGRQAERELTRRIYALQRLYLQKR